MPWQRILEDVFLFRDSCNVYAIRGSEGMIIIDAGTGEWLNHLDELPAAPVALLLTHYFRDHAAGAILAAKQGIPVYASEYEREMLSDPVQHFRQRQTYIVYDNLWDLFVPIEPISLAGVMKDYATVSLAGLSVEAVPLPGATLSQTGYEVTLPTGKTVVFCGETIHSPGRIPRIAPLQYNYNDLGGALNVLYSARMLRQRQPEALMPSLGMPMLSGIDDALSQLEQSLVAASEAFDQSVYDAVPLLNRPSLEQVTEHVWLSTFSNAKTWFIISESGKAMAIDYGYYWEGIRMQDYSCPQRRRALLHGLDELKQRFSIERLDMVLISHFHDDHVCGVPVLQRLFNTECWATENFADLLEQPDAHCFPCNWPEPIEVHRRIALDETVQWEEYAFHFAPMTGHTRFASLIGFEADGQKFAHTGDQVFLRQEETNALNNRQEHNHVYRNGALLDGMAQSCQWLLNWRPDIVLTGHRQAIHTDDRYFQLVEKGAREYEHIHKLLMPLKDDEAHFDVDSWGGWIWPYRVHLPEPQQTTVTVTVRNPLPRQAKLKVQLVGPTGWRGSEAEIDAPARAEVMCQLNITPAGSCRRQPFAVELEVEGQRFGQVAEALMTVGFDLF